MAQGAPWERYGAQAQAPQSAPPTIGYIPGVPDQPTALELRRDARADAAAARQAEASARAAAAAERSASTSERMAQNDERRVGREVFSDQAALRKEFSGLPAVKRFGDVRAAREQIRALSQNADNATAQDDLAMIFSFMRALDPGSVVREGEFATAQNAAGVPEQVRNQFNRIVSGERLSPQQRREFASTADRLYRAERDTYNQQATQYRQLAEAQGINPDFVARRYVPDQPSPDAAPIAGGQPVPTASRGMGEIEFGATGGAPAGADRYQREIEDGIRNGAITTADQVADVARRYGYAAPDPAQTEQMFEALRKGAPFGGALAPVYQSVLDQQAQLEQSGRGDAILDPAIRGAADAVTLGFADELTGIGNAIVTGGNVDENIALQRGVDQFDEQRNFLPRLGGQLAGGLALPTGGPNTVGRLAAVGAGYGGAYGFGSADGGLAERLSGAATGALIGGGIGAAGGALAQRLARPGGGGGGGNAAGRETYQAAIDAGIVGPDGRPLVLPADVGGPMARRFTAGISQTPFGAGPVTRAAEAAQDMAGQRLGQIAAAEGAPVRQEVLGEIGQNAAQGYIDRTGAAATRAYSAARDMVPEGSRLQARNALSNLDQQLGELGATANTDAPLIAGLERLRGDIARDGAPADLTIDAIRRLRTSTRAEAMSEGLRGTDYNRRAGQVLDALSADIAAQLPDDAARAFREADRAYAERLATIDDVMEQVVGARGDRSAEAVANRLVGLSRGDSARLGRFLNAVEPEEAGIVRGSLIQEMGRSTPGQQNAAGDAFSLQTFLTNWDKMPERTKNILFRGEHRNAIEGLARYAQGSRETARYANTSNTGGANSVSSLIGTVSGLSAFGTAGGSAVLENLTGRLLGSRRFAQWLARAPRNPAQRGQWARRLSTIASREPALAPDIAPLQAALAQSPGRAAADNER